VDAVNPIDAAGTPRSPHRGATGTGRLLDASRDAAILAAALEGLAERGYDRLSMDDIAHRAHAGKGALYRRWPSKAALVLAAVVSWREQMAPLDLPDTGSLAGDLEALIAAVPDFDAATRRLMDVFVGLVTASSRHPELQTALSDSVLERPRRVLRDVLDRAVVRGEIPAERDLDLIPDALLALNLLQLVLGGVPDREFVRRVIHNLIYPLVTAPQSTLPDGTAF
jgi:AcrR family transcriptional regulator